MIPMLKYDRILFNFLFGSVIPIFSFLLFWWGSLLFVKDDKEIAIAAFTGLGIGLVFSIILKLTLKPDIYNLSKQVLVLIYLFYNVGMFGFFMGVPVFHPVLGVIAGFYWAKRLLYRDGMVDYKNQIKGISGFTAIIVGIVCSFSAFFVLISKSIPSEIKHILHLSFDISQSMLISLIVFGGLFLVFAQFFLTKISMKMTLKMSNFSQSKETAVL